MVYFDQVLHANACQQYLATGMCNIIFEWARVCSASFQLVVVTGMQHGDKGLPSIILPGRGFLVKMPITVAALYILVKINIYIL